MTSVTDIMRAAIYRGPGGGEQIAFVERPIPAPGPDEVLIRVHAAGLNRPDLLQRAGTYLPSPGVTDIPGLEVAGEIVAAGSAVAEFHKGQAVMALLAGGGYADYAVAPQGQCLPLPSGWDFIAGGAFPETFFTVWANVFDRGGLRPGETLLVHGGASGIGTAAIQLGHHGGAHVIVTAGSDNKCNKCKQLGANLAINYRQEDFVARVMEETKGAGANVILDMVGGEYIARNLRCLARDGRLVQIAFQNGSIAKLDLAHVMVKRQWITGSTLRPRTVAEKSAIASGLRQRFWPLLEKGAIRPVVDRLFRFEELRSAQDYLEEGKHFGKIVLKFAI
ncbi:MAG TPA: NAD(P)H-quinone oxidoreductase [Dongiaceae bacterium]|jgi:putative PIG3 family NAD(P)H quinone oxidoreductase|nr:NAD(P)H-quinone oxidoreductase [Dongiaceae bacterium]